MGELCIVRLWLYLQCVSFDSFLGMFIQFCDARKMVGLWGGKSEVDTDISFGKKKYGLQFTYSIPEREELSQLTSFSTVNVENPE